MNITMSNEKKDKLIPFKDVPYGVVFKTPTCIKGEWLMRFRDIVVYLNTNNAYEEKVYVDDMCTLYDHELIIKGEL